MKTHLPRAVGVAAIALLGRALTTLPLQDRSPSARLPT